MYVESAKYTVCLSKACDTEYSKVLAYVARNNLKKKYANTDILSTSKLRQDLNILKLKEKGDPTNFFENISTI